MTRATVSVTFDNLGEVSDLQRGWWPEDKPLGRHFSVTEALPRLLEALEESGLRASFFVEGLNADLYPDALRALDAAGHEVAYHGWCHERWGGLRPGEERELLGRGVRRMGELGLRPVGFRPPGGELTAATPAILRELGFAHASPAGGDLAVCDGIVLLPFRWELLDAFHYLPHFGALRERILGSPAELPPARLREAVFGALDDLPREGGHLTLLFHPFLLLPAERLAVVRDCLARVRALVDAGAVSCAPCRDVAASF